MSRRLLVSLFVVSLGLWLVRPLEAQADAADSAWVRGDRTSAERLYRGRLAADSTDATALFRLALLAGWEEKRTESIALLDRLLRLWPGDNDARLARARMLAAAGRGREAGAAIDTVLRMEPGSVGALQLRARFTGFAGDLEESERLWRAVLGLEPGNLETRVGLSQVLRRQGRPGAAAEALRPIRDFAAADSDLRVELDRVRELTEPRARSRVVREDDSDGNAITTLALHAATRAGRGTDLRADAWFRSARLGPSPAVSVRGGTLTVATVIEPGWLVQASAGLSTVDRGPEASASWTFALGSPRRHRWATTVSASRQAHDFNAPTALRGVRADLYELAVTGRLGAAWATAAGVSAGRYVSQSSGVSNGRLAGNVSLARGLSETFSLGLQAAGFGFERDADDGYFDPDLYGIAAVELQFRSETPRWVLVAAAAPGVQQVGIGGAPTGALHAKAGLDLIARPGRSIGITAVWANTGTQQLSARPAGTYRYASIGLDIRWRFR